MVRLVVEVERGLCHGVVPLAILPVAARNLPAERPVVPVRRAELDDEVVRVCSRRPARRDHVVHTAGLDDDTILKAAGEVCPQPRQAGREDGIVGAAEHNRANPAGGLALGVAN